MDAAGGQCARARDLEMQEFGQKFAKIFCQLNDTCRQFFEYLSNHVFRNEKAWRSALLVFKKGVLESAGAAACSRNEANEMYRQIENFLVDPTNLRLVKNKSGKKCRLAIADSLMHLSLDVSSRSSATCVVCKVPSGIFVSCSGRRCTNTFHIFCAAAVTRCKNPPSLYYRCRSCAASVIAGGAVSTAKKKRRRKNAAEKEKGDEEEDEESEESEELEEEEEEEEEKQMEEEKGDDEEDEEEDQNGEDDGESLNLFFPACSVCQRGCDTVCR